MKMRKHTSKTNLVLLPTVSFSLTYCKDTSPQPIVLRDITTSSEDQVHLFEILKQIPKEKLGAFAKAINTLSTEIIDHRPAINKNNAAT